MPLRRYTNVAPPLPLLSGINQTAPTLSVSSTSGYPDAPFLIAIERGTPNEEVVLCTSKTGTTFTVERGYDNTTGKVHDVGVFIEHTTAAIDFREAQMVRITTAERDALLPDEIWNGRIIWNSTTMQLELREPFEGWADLIPAGVILPFGGSVLPKGWVWAQGQTISRTDYARLFAALGTTFGAGNGTTTFGVPDMRRRLPLGRHTSGGQTTLGETGGSMDHVHTNSPTTSAGSHSHTQGSTGAAGNHAHSSGSLNQTFSGLSPTQTGQMTSVQFAASGSAVPAGEHRHEQGSMSGSTATTGNHTHSNPSTSSGGSHTHNVGNTGTANPPYIVLNYIIKV